MNKKLTRDFQNIFHRELERLGVNQIDRTAIYNNAIAPFGNAPIVHDIEHKFLIPAAIKTVAGDDYEAAINDLQGFMAQNLVELMKVSSKQWAWLLTEEVIAMQMSLNEEIPYAEQSDTKKATNEILKWFLDDLPRLDDRESSNYYFYDEPFPGVRDKLDSAQLAVRACAIKTQYAIDQKTCSMMDLAVVKAMNEQFSYTPPTNLPNYDFPTCRCLCGIRYCIYLIYSIDGAQEMISNQ